MSNQFGNLVMFANAKQPYREREESMKKIRYHQIIVGTSTLFRGIQVSHASIGVIYDAEPTDVQVK